MYQSVLTLAAVVALSSVIASLDNAQGQRQVLSQSPGLSWVRTTDGWEDHELLWSEYGPTENPALHPLLVATFQLSASLFVLVAFPSAPRRM